MEKVVFEVTRAMPLCAFCGCLPCVHDCAFTQGDLVSMEVIVAGAGRMMARHGWDVIELVGTWAWETTVMPTMEGFIYDEARLWSHDGEQEVDI